MHYSCFAEEQIDRRGVPQLLSQVEFTSHEGASSSELCTLHLSGKTLSYRAFLLRSTNFLNPENVT